MVNWTLGQLIGQDWTPPLHTDRGGYTVTMRETSGSEQVIRALRQKSLSNTTNTGKLHLGWGSFRNLDIMAARQCQWGLLLDINIHQFTVWDAVFEALRQTDRQEDFVDCVVPLIPDSPKPRQFANSTSHWLKADFLRPDSWLNFEHPDRFSHIQRMVIEGRIITACLDMRGSTNGHSPLFDELAQNLKVARELGVSLDTLYVSNIPWMLNQQEGFFGESHQLHLHDQSVQATRQAKHNLQKIVQEECHIISAMHLTPTATAENLHWDTRLYTPAQFFSDAVWQEMSVAQPNKPSGE
jgi:hypothetical protein